jgi:hypothetical protein
MARPSALELANEIARGKVSPEQEIGLSMGRDIKLPIPTQDIGLEMGLSL